MRAIRAAALAVIALPLVSAASLHALLIDGPESHPQTAAVQKILEASDLFRLDVLTSPAKGNPFDPPFDRYKVVILNYGGDAWPVPTMAALEKFVQAGGGLVVLASADSAFPTWTAYNEMLGVSGAPNRDKSTGPIWFYAGENLAFDGDTPGPAGKAPQPDQPFQVTIRNTEHPVAKGLPLIWMHTSDTLSGNLRGPGKNMVVLATAHSDKDHGGTGRDEPVLLAISYGKGRVFHTLLGRTADGMTGVGYQTTLQRGAEWAATGKVTIRMPTDFPHEDKPSVHPLTQDVKQDVKPDVKPNAK
jgi:hypothetical protein